MGHFRGFYYSIFANYVRATSASTFMLLNVKLFFDQIVANLPKTVPETKRFLKTFETLVFFEKRDGFLDKKTWTFSISTKVANLL